MPLIRLIGLTLFITAIFLALVSAITKTSEIEIQMPGAGATIQPGQSGTAVLPPPNLPDVDAGQLDQNANFTSVPIVWPLLIAGGTGLLMWFIHPATSPSSARMINKRRGKRR